MTTRLSDVARILRSKNAGPTLLTIDAIFDNAEDMARAATVLTPAAVASRYGVPADSVRVIAYLPAHALKVTLPRAVIAGGPGDRDVYGAQAHGPLLDLPL